MSSIRGMAAFLCLAGAVACGRDSASRSASAPTATTVAAVAAAPGIVDAAYLPVYNLGDYTCLVAPGSTGEPAVVKTACDLSFRDQLWKLVPAGDGYYRLENMNNGMCVVVRGGDAEASAVVTPCTNLTDQQFEIHEVVTGKFFTARKRNTDHCLVMRADQSELRQVPCDAQATDQWWGRGMPFEPNRSDDLAKPIYFVHGYKLTPDGTPLNVRGAYFNHLINAFAGSFAHVPLARAWTYCYYTDDVGCDVQKPGGLDKPIKDIGADLAWDIYNRFSRFNIAVDVVGHSMGGLVMRAALTGVERGEAGFPPYLYVEDAITVATPHRGVAGAFFIHWILTYFNIQTSPQIEEMIAGSAFFDWAADHPQGRGGTYWTHIGSDDDMVATAGSAAPENSPADRKVRFREGQLIPKLNAHMDILNVTGSLDASVCESTWACDGQHNDTWTPSRGPNPTQWALFAAAHHPSAPRDCGRANAGEGLFAGVSLWSCDGRFELKMQDDGNLVLYWQGVGPIWASNTYLSGALYAVMQFDGNLSVYTPAGDEMWTSNTHHNTGDYLAVQDDGNLVIYSAGGAVLWASNSVVPPPPPPNSAPEWSAYVDIWNLTLYWITIFADAPAQFGLNQVGILHAGQPYTSVYCKAWGGVVGSGGSYNHWWLWTDPDIGSGSAWVSAYYLSNWGNDEARDDAGNVIPDCQVNPSPPPPPPPVPSDGAPTWNATIDIWDFMLYYTTIFADAPAMRGTTQIGTMYAGTPYVYCKAWGGVIGNDSGFNHWWLWSDPDTGGVSAWISAYYLSYWGNDEARDDSGTPIPDCHP